MSYIAKPNVTHPKLKRNKLGLTPRDYEGTVSTLCAGCGHDSVTAALIQAIRQFFIDRDYIEVDTPVRLPVPHRMTMWSMRSTRKSPDNCLPGLKNS